MKILEFFSYQFAFNRIFKLGKFLLPWWQTTIVETTQEFKHNTQIKKVVLKEMVFNFFKKSFYNDNDKTYAPASLVKSFKRSQCTMQSHNSVFNAGQSTVDLKDKKKE